MVVIDRSALASSMMEAASQILQGVKTDQASRKQLGDRLSGQVDAAADAAQKASGELLVMQAKIYALQLARIPMVLGAFLQIADMVKNVATQEGRDMAAQAGAGKTFGALEGWMQANKSSVDGLMKSLTSIGENEEKLRREIQEAAKQLKKLRDAAAFLGGVQGK